MTLDLAFPRPDHEVREFLVTDTSIDTVNISYLKFLGGLFKAVTQEVEACKPEVNSREMLAKWWSSHLESNRQQLYKAAITTAVNQVRYKYVTNITENNHAGGCLHSY
jgi:hypothetical protein